MALIVRYLLSRCALNMAHRTVEGDVHYVDVHGGISELRMSSHALCYVGSEIGVSGYSYLTGSRFSNRCY